MTNLLIIYMSMYNFYVIFFVLINSKRASHFSLNSYFASYSSFLVRIAQIEAIGTNIIEQNKQNEEKRNPKISPFFLKFEV